MNRVIGKSMCPNIGSKPKKEPRKLQEADRATHVLHVNDDVANASLLIEIKKLIYASAFLASPDNI